MMLRQFASSYATRITLQQFLAFKILMDNTARIETTPPLQGDTHDRSRINLEMQNNLKMCACLW
jgi:hypothetical protein